jgi:hypothetical protein
LIAKLEEPEGLKQKLKDLKKKKLENRNEKERSKTNENKKKLPARLASSSTMFNVVEAID